MPVNKQAAKNTVKEYQAGDDLTAELKTFHSHGVDVVSGIVESGEVKADCPFCGGAAFFVNGNEGTYHCKTCPSQGNKYVFMQQWYDRCFEKTTQAARTKLAKDRKLPLEAIEWAEYAYDSINKRWLIPVRNERGSMVNLGRFSLTQLIDGKRPVLMTGGCKTHLGNLERLGDSQKVFICEGPWDCIALEWLLAQSKDKSAVLWVPGSNNFQQDWAKFFNNKEVVFLFDNDDPGYLGMERAAQIIRDHGKPRSISQIKWADSFPEKFDIRDFVGKKQKTPKKALTELLQMVEEVHFTKAKSHSVERTKLEDVVKDFEQTIHVTPEMKDGLAIALAIILSNRIFRDPYNPLWMFIIAPPGCLTGDTKVTVNRAGKSFQITLDDLYLKYHGGRTMGKNWRLSIPTMIQHRSEHDGCIRLTEVLDVMDSGVKTVYELTLVDGRKIKTSSDHRFFTEQGWKPLKQLTIKDKVYADVGQGRRQQKAVKKDYPQTIGLYHHPNATKKTPSRKYPKGCFCVPTHRAVVEANMNGISLSEYVSILRTCPNMSKTLKFLSTDLHVHHKDHDVKNFNLDNLEVCSAKEHFTSKHDFSSHVLYQTFPVRIKSIKKCGRERTYDLSVEAPHNFIANGMTVHNSGKTLLLQTLAGSDMTRFETTMGPKTLVSGFKTPDNSDASLLPLLIGKTLIIEDFTGLMSLPSGEQEEIYGQLRSIFNGRYEKTFGHIGTRVYPDPDSGHDTCHFTILAGCTGAIHADARANKGERFLKYHMASLTNDNVPQVESAIKNTLDQTTPEILLREPVEAFIDYKLANVPDDVAKVPKWVEQRIIGLGQIVATIRAVVLRKNGELVVRPEAEVATRLSKQFIKLGQALAFVFDKSQVDDSIYRIIQRVAMDTCYGWHRDAVVAVAAASHPIRTEEVSRDAVMSRSTAFRCLEDMLELGAVTFDLAASSKKGGKPSYLWRLTPVMADLWKRAKIDTLALSRQVPMGKDAKKRLKANAPPSSPRKGATPTQSKRRKAVGTPV